MILDVILLVVNSILTLIVNTLPVVNLPGTLATTTTTVFSEIGKFNGIFPLTDFFIVVGLMIAVELALVSIRLLLWVVHLLRGN